MNWNRILVLTLFDLRQSVFRVKGLVFLLPYCIFWYWILKILYQSGNEALTSVQSIAFLSWLYDHDVARTLLIDHPPTLSLFYLVMLATVPAFSMLAGHNQLSGAAGKNLFRCYLTRTTRLEIFIGRFLGFYILLGIASLITNAITMEISLLNDQYTLAETLDYAIRIQVCILMYILPFAAFVYAITALMSSAISSLLMCLVAYVFLLVAGNMIQPETGIQVSLVPAVIKKFLLGLHPGDLWYATTGVILYTTIYLGLGWIIFRRRIL